MKDKKDLPCLKGRRAKTQCLTQCFELSGKNSCKTTERILQPTVLFTVEEVLVFKTGAGYQRFARIRLEGSDTTIISTGDILGEL